MLNYDVSLTRLGSRLVNTKFGLERDELTDWYSNYILVWSLYLFSRLSIHFFLYRL
jgi:hypothetical protein